MDLNEVGILREELRNHETLDAGRRAELDRKIDALNRNLQCVAAAAADVARALSQAPYVFGDFRKTGERPDPLAVRRDRFERALNRLRKMGHSE